MNTNNDLNSLEPDSNKSVRTATLQSGQRFLLPWRLNPDTAHSQWHQGDDAGCGNCPVD